LPYIFQAIFIVIYGLAIGSFLNVLIYRIPLGKSVALGRSYCPNCNSLIPWFRNIPIISYLLLKGHCRDCGTSISFVYPLVELLNGLLWLLAWFKYGFTVYALFIALLSSLLIVVTFIDLKHQIIPNGLILVILGLGVINLIYQTLVLGHHWSFWVIGFFAASLPLYIMALIHPKGMGGGDIKFMAVAGFFIGWRLILLTLFLGAIYALFYAAFLLLLRKPLKGIQIPFGPFLSLGILTSLFAGEELIGIYLEFIFSF
jgi:leader peptidase (prepilin peptidase)/N-methyltransferase